MTSSMDIVMVAENTPSNPLLEPLGPFRDLPEWPALLEFDPLESFPLAPTMEERDEFLNYAKDRFAVTKPALRIAFEVQSMMRAGYRERNPCDPANRRKLYALAELQGKFDLKAPTFYPDARCMILMAITGMGKSSMLKRILAAYDQVAVHGRNDAAQWLKHTQVIHLIVKMPADGSRGGLLYAILAALDSVLSTDYFNDYNKRTFSVEKLTLKVAQLLALHSVGLLVIEEMQAKNFKDSKFRHELQLFFLGVLSFGVPLLLLGNPRAFEELHTFKQTESRFLSYEPATLWPYASYKDPDWLHAIAPAIWHHQVVEQSEPFSEAIAEALWQCTGGIPGYARRLVTEVQKSVLRRSAAGLTLEALRSHYDSLASFRQFRPTIEGLVRQDDTLLQGAEDLPVEAFVQRWKSLIQEPTEDVLDAAAADVLAESRPPEDAWQDYQSRQLRKRKVSATRRARKARANERLRQNAEADDLRRGDQLEEVLSKSLKQLQATIQRDRDDRG